MRSYGIKREEGFVEIKNVILEEELKNVTLEKDGNLAIVTINRPKALNALNSDTLNSYLENSNVNIGIICVPRINAQKVCDLLVKGGIKGIWNFAPVDLVVPNDVKVENVHLSESLLTLVYLMKDE